MMYEKGFQRLFPLKFLNIIYNLKGKQKSKLGTPEARNIVDSIVYEKIILFLRRK